MGMRWEKKRLRWLVNMSAFLSASFTNGQATSWPVFWGTHGNATVAPDKAPTNWVAGRMWKQRHGEATAGRNRGKGSQLRRKLRRQEVKLESVENWRRQDDSGKRQLMATGLVLEEKLRSAQELVEGQRRLLAQARQLKDVATLPELNGRDVRKGLRFHKGRVQSAKQVMRRQFVEMGILRDGLVEAEAEIWETHERGDKAVAKRRA